MIEPYVRVVCSRVFQLAYHCAVLSSCTVPPVFHITHRASFIRARMSIRHPSDAKVLRDLILHCFVGPMSRLGRALVPSARALQAVSGLIHVWTQAML